MIQILVYNPEHKINDNMKKTILSLALGSVVLFSQSCTDTATVNDDTKVVNTEKPATQPVEEQGVKVGGAMMVPSKNIVENALGSNDHTTLVAAVKAAGLVETLSGAGPFTVFAPTNAAFSALPAGTVDNLVKPENKDKLTKILTYHVVAGAYTSKDLKSGMELKTVEGKTIKIMEKDGMWWANDSKIEIADVISSNGVTFVVDKVLMP